MFSVTNIYKCSKKWETIQQKRCYDWPLGGSTEAIIWLMEVRSDPMGMNLDRVSSSKRLHCDRRQSSTCLLSYSGCSFFTDGRLFWQNTAYWTTCWFEMFLGSLMSEGDVTADSDSLCFLWGGEPDRLDADAFPPQFANSLLTIHK